MLSEAKPADIWPICSPLKCLRTSRSVLCRARPRAATEPLRDREPGFSLKSEPNMAGTRHQGNTGGHGVLPSVQTHSGNRHHPCLQTPDHLQDRYGCAGLSRALGMPTRPQHHSPTAPPQGPCPRDVTTPPAPALRPAPRSDALFPQKRRLGPQINM